jgi:hypothetical protein
MGWKQVDKYRLGYSVRKRTFYFYYRLEGENTVYQLYPSAAEFMALADMFRNEGPISFNTEGQYFVTAAEEVGEEETQP